MSTEFDKLLKDTKEDIVSEVMKVISPLIEELRTRDKLYFKLTQDLLTQIKFCLENEIPLKTETLLKTLEESIGEYSKVSKVPILQK